MPVSDPHAASTWTLHDGAAGNRRQVQALALALQRQARDWSLQASSLARWLAPRRWPGMPSSVFGETFAQALREQPPALAIGCGSLFFSHVNDAGFWLVKEYFGMTVGQTIKTWSVMETIISVVGVICVFLLNIVV